MSHPVNELRQFDSVQPTPLWSAIEARHPGPEIPPPVRPLRRVVVIVAALALFAGAGAFAWSAFRPEARSILPETTDGDLKSYVNPMGIHITADYPSGWYAQSLSQDSNLDPSQTGPLQVGLVISNTEQAMPSPGATAPSPGPLPENPDLPMDFVTVTIRASADAIGSVDQDSALPLSMDDAKVAPGPENLRSLRAVVAGTPIDVTVAAGPNYSKTDLATANAIVASIRPSDTASQPPTPSPSPEAGGQTFRSDAGWGAAIPAGWTSASFSTSEGAARAAGVVISNDGLPAPTLSPGYPIQTNSRDLPPDGVSVVIASDSDPGFEGPASPGPLPLAPFESGGWSVGSAPAGTPYMAVAWFSLDGQDFIVDVKVGPEVSKSTMSDLRALISSIAPVDQASVSDPPDASATSDGIPGNDLGVLDCPAGEQSAVQIYPPTELVPRSVAESVPAIVRRTFLGIDLNDEITTSGTEAGTRVAISRGGSTIAHAFLMPHLDRWELSAFTSCASSGIKPPSTNG